MLYAAFNLTFFIIMAIFALFLFGTIKFLRKKDEAFVTKYLVCFYLLGIVIFFIYKYFLINDVEYGAFFGVTNRTIFEELPLFPCNIVMCIMPIAVLTKKRGLLAFCFFTSFIAAPLALIIPSDGFVNCSIFLPRVMGYVTTHLMVWAAFFYLYFLEIFIPTYKDVPKFLLTVFVIASIIFGINNVLQVTGLGPTANYFFSMFPESDEMRILYSYIPIKFVYTWPAILIEALIALLITAVITKIRKIKGKQ